MESEKTENESVELAPVPAPRTKGCVSENDTTDSTTNDGTRKSNSSSLMPPPPAPILASADETLNKRPQRAAKLKSEKNLKEPKLSTKLRRPMATDEVKVKMEHEQRASQMHTGSSLADENETSKDSLSQKSDESVVVVPGKQPSIVSINSDTEDTASGKSAGTDVQQNQKAQSE